MTWTNREKIKSNKHSSLPSSLSRLSSNISHICYSNQLLSNALRPSYG